MTNKILAYAVALLGAACLTEGYWLAARSMRAPSAAEEFAARHERWVAEIEKLKARMAPLGPAERDPDLGRAVEEWFQARVAVSGIRSEIKVTDSQVVVVFNIPGLKAETLKIAVDDVLIRASYSARSFVQDKDAGGAYGGEAVRRFETVMPVPANADPNRHRFIQEGEGFRIIFEKRDDPALKS